MGDSPPEYLDLQCSDCGTRFRIRPTKGRLPKGPVECPSCGHDVAVSAPAPAAAVLRPRSKSGAASIEVESDEDRLRKTLAHIGDAPTGGTLMGMTVRVEDLPKGATKSLDESTATAEPESSAKHYETTIDGGFPGDIDSQVDHTPTRKIFALDEHSESDHNNRTKAPWESKSMMEAEREAGKTAESNLRKTLSNLQAIPTSRPRTSEHEPAESSTTQAATSGERPRLADLLKQVREKRGPLIAPPQMRESQPTRPALALDRLDELFDSSTNDLAAFEGPSSSEHFEQLERTVKRPTSDPRATPFGKARAETVVRAMAAHGMAAEQTGSGFIRIPTAEILDVIGRGTYRLEVEGVVYEPIDEEAIRRLVIAGVLTGQELIAERAGNWQMLASHPFFNNVEHAQMTQELDEISEEDAVEELLDGQPQPPALPRADGSGELFPTLGHLSPDQSQELHRAYVEKSHASDVSNLNKLLGTADPISDAPITAELDTDDMEDPVEPASPPTPVAQDIGPPKRGRPGLWVAVLLAGVAGLAVAAWMEFGNVNLDDSVKAPITNGVTSANHEPIADPNPPQPKTNTAAAVAQTNQATHANTDVDVPQTNQAVAEGLPSIGLRMLTDDDLEGAEARIVGKTPVIRLTLDGAPTTFLADNGAPQRAYRSTHAVYEFCQAVRCGIAFPITQEAFVPLGALKAAGIDLQGAHLSEHDGTQGVFGVLKRDVDSVAQLPLAELTPVWRRWMRASDEDLDKAVPEFKAELEKALGKERSDAIIAQTAGTQLRDFVRQISNVLVLDYLTNNFERFDSNDDAATWNLGVKNGRIYSLDESAAFQPRASTRVKGRFMWTDRFDKALFESAQNVDRDDLTQRMYGDPTPAEKVSLRVFWNQYDNYIARVKKEAAKNAEDTFF